MAIPNVKVTPLSTGVGIILPGTNELPCNVMGWTSHGEAAQPTSVLAGGLSTLTAEFGVGPAVELAATVLSAGATEVIITRILGATIASTFAKSGSGPNITASGNPLKLYGNPNSTGSTGIIVDVDVGGTLGTMTFSFSLDGGTTFVGPIVSSASPYLVPGTGVTLTFAAGTWVAADVYTGAITTAVGSSSAVQQLPVPGQSLQGSGAVTMDATNNPQDAYNVIILVASTGVLGVGQYAYSLDGGITFASDTLIPSSGPSILGSSGIVIDWANTGGGGGTSGFIEGETYVFTTLPPSISTTEIIQTCNAITGNAAQWDWAHVVGRPSSNSNAAALFAALSTQAGTWWSAGRYSWFVMETPTVTQQNNGSAALIAAFANSASDYVSVGAGDFNCISAISGQAIQRNAAWAATIWGSGKTVGIDLAAPVLGSLPFVVAELWNSQEDGSLDNARFTTMRTFHNLIGNFICNAWLKSNSQSDILYWQHRRILNAAARIAYQVLVAYLSTPVLVNKSDGTIAPSAAVAIQNATMRAINQGLTGQITGSSAVVDTSNDILTTQQLNETVGIIPFGYPKEINVNIGFVDPATSTQ